MPSHLRPPAAALLLAASAALSATPLAGQDAWFARDKAEHFVASAVIATGAYAFAIPVWDCKRPRALFGAGVALGAGLLKEWSDARGGGQASWKDLAWDVLGVASGLAVMWGFDAAPGSCPAEGGPAGVESFSVPDLGVVGPAGPLAPWPGPLPLGPGIGRPEGLPRR
ncbi:MAG: hypothetical protein R3E98_08245 [Gemmatimonadota bacterium]